MQTATPAAELSRPAVPAARTASGASVAAFRIAFGLLVFLSSIRFLLNGWINTLYLDPSHHLTYRWFGWVAPGPPWLLHVELVALALSGLCIAAGLRHRISCVVFLVLFGHTELIDASLYLNHYWFLTLTGVLLLLLPVNHQWSWDARSGRVDRSDQVPLAVVWILRAHVGSVYAFAGLAKINADWLLRAEPLRLWFADRADTPMIGPLLAIPAVAWMASWSAAALDLSAAALLSHTSTRRFAYAALVIFHTVTGLLFQIGVFPLVMVMAGTIFFRPTWPLELRSRFTTVPPPAFRASAVRPPIRPVARVAIAALAVMQIVLPLRHYAIDSNVRWSEEGYLLAWRVMLTEKAGHLEFEVTDAATNQRWTVAPTHVLTDWQASAAATRPDLIKATADLLERELEAGGSGPVEIRAHAWISMNGREAVRLLDPTINLVAYDRGAMPTGWILPAPWNRDDQSSGGQDP